MNLFVLDRAPGTAARILSDQHIPKMILETAQILDGGTRPIMYNLYPTGSHHIVAIPRSHRDNRCIMSASSHTVWGYAFQHFHALLTEFHYRFGHDHAYAKDTELLKALADRGKKARPGMNQRGFYLAMPDAYKTSKQPHVYPGDAVASYRAYYAATKTTYGAQDRPSTWRLRPPPLWLDRYRVIAGDRRMLTTDGRFYHYAPNLKADAA